MGLSDKQVLLISIDPENDTPKEIDMYAKGFNKNLSEFGNINELKALVHTLSSNEVRVLIGVKDDKYQQVYTKYFGRVKPQRDDLFIKALNDDYGSFNADFNISSFP